MQSLAARSDLATSTCTSMSKRARTMIPRELSCTPAQLGIELLELPDNIVELILSFVPTRLLSRIQPCSWTLKHSVDAIVAQRARCLKPPLLETEELHNALVLYESTGAASTAWEYKTAQRSTLLRHGATGASIALCHESVGWLRYQACVRGEERICWSSGASNPQEFSRDEATCRDDKSKWRALAHCLRQASSTIGGRDRSWKFEPGRLDGTIELSNEYFHGGRDCVHVLDASGATLRMFSSRTHGRFGVMGGRLGLPLSSQLMADASAFAQLTPSQLTPSQLTPSQLTTPQLTTPQLTTPQLTLFTGDASTDDASAAAALTADAFTAGTSQLTPHTS